MYLQDLPRSSDDCTQGINTVGEPIFSPMGSYYFYKLQHYALCNSENANMQIYRLWPSTLLA